MLTLLAALAIQTASADPTFTQASCTIGFSGTDNSETSEAVPCMVAYDYDAENDAAGVGFFFDETLAVIYVGEPSEQGIDVKILGSTAEGAVPQEVDSGTCGALPGQGIYCEGTIDGWSVKVTAMPSK